MGLISNSKGLESSDGSAQDQSMDVMSACEKKHNSSKLFVWFRLNWTSLHQCLNKND